MSSAMRKTLERLAEREQRERKREQQARLWQAVPFLIVGLIALLGVGFVIYGAFFEPARVQGVNGPRLQLDREQIDFGDRHFNTSVHAVFNIKNTGDGTLTLDPPKTAKAVEGC